MFLEIYLLHSGCPIPWHIVVHSNFLQSFVFLWYRKIINVYVSHSKEVIGDEVFFSWFSQTI